MKIISRDCDESNSPHFVKPLQISTGNGIYLQIFNAEHTYMHRSNLLGNLELDLNDLCHRVGLTVTRLWFHQH